MANVEDLISIVSAADQLQISRQAVHAAIGRGDLHAVPIAGRRLLLRAEVANYRPISYAGRPGRPHTGIRDLRAHRGNSE